MFLYVSALLPNLCRRNTAPMQGPKVAGGLRLAKNGRTVGLYAAKVGKQLDASQPSFALMVGSVPYRDLSISGLKVFPFGGYSHSVQKLHLRIAHATMSQHTGQF
jgi:hypothetical protein